jgi:hypothetical protein
MYLFLACFGIFWCLILDHHEKRVFHFLVWRIASHDTYSGQIEGTATSTSVSSPASADVIGAHVTLASSSTWNNIWRCLTLPFLLGTCRCILRTYHHWRRRDVACDSHSASLLHPQRCHLGHFWTSPRRYSDVSLPLAPSLLPIHRSRPSSPSCPPTYAAPSLPAGPSCLCFTDRTQALSTASQLVHKKVATFNTVQPLPPVGQSIAQGCHLRPRVGLQVWQHDAVLM